MQGNKNKTFKNFDDLYDEIISLGILPLGEPSKNRFAYNTPQALRNLWFNLFNAQSSNELTVLNFKACIKKRLIYIRKYQQDQDQPIKLHSTLFSIRPDPKIYEAFKLNFFFWLEVNTDPEEQQFLAVYERERVFKNVSIYSQAEFIKNLIEHIEYLIKKYKKARLYEYREEELLSYSERFKTWLNFKLKELNMVDSINPNVKKTLPQKVIALKYVYLFQENEGSGIDKHNRDEIAFEHGYTSKNSGKKLYDLFIKLSGNNTNRISLE